MATLFPLHIEFRYKSSMKHVRIMLKVLMMMKMMILKKVCSRQLYVIRIKQQMLLVEYRNFMGLFSYVSKELSICLISSKLYLKFLMKFFLKFLLKFSFINFLLTLPVCASGHGMCDRYASILKTFYASISSVAFILKCYIPALSVCPSDRKCLQTRKRTNV